MCQPLLSPVGPIRAPEWQRLWITHLYPLKAREGVRQPLASMCRWVSALACDTDKSRGHSHFQPAVTLSARECQCDFARAVRSAELGKSSLLEGAGGLKVVFPPRPPPNHSRRIVIALPRAKTFFFYDGTDEQTGPVHPHCVFMARSALLWFAVVDASVSTVSSQLAAFQTASLFPGGSHSCCQHGLTHSEPVLCPGLQM